VISAGSQDHTRCLYVGICTESFGLCHRLSCAATRGPLSAEGICSVGLTLLHFALQKAFFIAFLAIVIVLYAVLAVPMRYRGDTSLKSLPELRVSHLSVSGSEAPKKPAVRGRFHKMAVMLA
jgi:hypothetical protein